jgi:YHS domain-containing protein
MKRPTFVKLKTSETNLPMKKLFLTLLASASLMGCAPLITQSPNGSIRPLNAVSEGDDKHLMLFGHDVVAYFTENAHKKGDPAIKSVIDGVTFRFSNAQHKALFDKEPAKYMPQYNGYCANGIVYGIPWGGDADSWRIIEGKLYIFGGKGSRDGFLVNVPRNRELADKYWKEEVNGSNAYRQRIMRAYLNRVPHYKSGAEVADEVRKAGAGQS